ncbi:MAG TPA: hypothetical protein VK177_00915 [Flavobacteriales bacterium]|nr:hypothetical protein [Flavobacteriales bacterium]
MLICKIFSGASALKVESDINDFLEKSQQIDIHSIVQSSQADRIFITLFFNVKTRNSIKNAQPVEQIEAIVSKAELP